jgi:hypothetical protein
MTTNDAGKGGVKVGAVVTGGVHVAWVIEDRRAGVYVARYDVENDVITYTAEAREALVTHYHVWAGRVGRMARYRDGHAGMRIGLCCC